MWSTVSKYLSRIKGVIYLLIGEIEVLAEVSLVLCAQVGVPFEGLLQAGDLLCCEGCTRPPTTRGRHCCRAAVLHQARRQRVTTFTLVA